MKVRAYVKVRNLPTCDERLLTRKVTNDDNDMEQSANLEMTLEAEKALNELRRSVALALSDYKLAMQY